MGVKGLWSLLEPTGRRVNIEALGGRRVAVDASIWLVQFIKAMRDEKGDMLPNAHIMGENKTAQVRRTAEKLLLNAMKASVLNAALNKDKHGGKSGGGTSGGGDSGGGGGGDVVEVHETTTAAAAAARRSLASKAKGKRPEGHREDDEEDTEEEEEEQWERWEDFEDAGGDGGGGGRSATEVDGVEDHHVDLVELDEDLEWAVEEQDEEEEDEEEDEDMMIPDADDIDPEVLGSLPPSVQMEVMLKMRERRVMDNREQFQSLSGKMRDFSELQLSTYLKSTQLKRKMETVIKGSGSGGAVKKDDAIADGVAGGGQLAALAGGSSSALVSGGGGSGDGIPQGSGGGGGGGDFLRGQRIASLHDREYVYSKPVVPGRKYSANAANTNLASSLFGLKKDPPPFGGGGFGGGGGRWGGGGGSGGGRWGGGGRSGGGGGRGGRYGVLGAGGPLKAPQERFLLSGLHSVLPTPTVSRTIAEMPVLPLDQRAGNEGSDSLDLQITFDAEDAAEAGFDPLFADEEDAAEAGVDPLFADEEGGGRGDAEGVTAAALPASSDPALTAAVDEDDAEDEWEDVQEDEQEDEATAVTGPATAFASAGETEEEGKDDDAEEEEELPADGSAAVRRRDFWSLNHGFLKGRRLDQWDADEEIEAERRAAAAAGGVSVGEAEELELAAVLNAVEATEGKAEGARREGRGDEKRKPIRIGGKLMGTDPVKDEAEEAQLQAAIAASLSTAAVSEQPKPEHRSESEPSGAEHPAEASGSWPRVSAAKEEADEEADLQAAIGASLNPTPVRVAQSGASNVDGDVEVLDVDDHNMEEEKGVQRRHTMGKQSEKEEEDEKIEWTEVEDEKHDDDGGAVSPFAAAVVEGQEDWTIAGKIREEGKAGVDNEVTRMRDEDDAEQLDVDDIVNSDIIMNGRETTADDPPPPTVAEALGDGDDDNAAAAAAAAAAESAPEEKEVMLSASFLEDEHGSSPPPSPPPAQPRTVHWAEDVEADPMQEDSQPPSPPSPAALYAARRKEEADRSLAAAAAAAAAATTTTTPPPMTVDTTVSVTLHLPNGADPVEFRTLDHFEAAAARAVQDYPPYLPPEHTLERDIVEVVCRGHRFDVCAPVAESLPAIAAAIKRALAATSPFPHGSRGNDNGGGGGGGGFSNQGEEEEEEGDAALFAAAEAAELEAAGRRRLESLLDETDVERGALQGEARQAARGADAPTDDMYRQVQELLTLFGVPYVIAPQEAEAQCAWMNHAGLVDAVITDDSDAFLFGNPVLEALHVYRNVFESKKYVEVYAADRIAAELGLDRARMAELALLLGSDYTEGVSGVGIVNALEVVTSFPGIEGLKEFREWVELSEFTGVVPNALRLPAGESAVSKCEKSGKNKKQATRVNRKGDGKVKGKVIQSPELSALTKLTVTETKALLTSRGLPTSGRKDDLIRRLEESCGSLEDEEEDEDLAAAAADDGKGEEEKEEEDEDEKDEDDEEEDKRRRRFKEQHRVVKKGWELPPSFPSSAVLEAYAKPSVDQSKERLEWGRPDLDLLRLFCLEHFNWHRPKTDELLIPVLKLWAKHDHQSRIDSFFTAAASQGGGPAGFNERFAKYRSERIRNAVAGLTGKALDPELAIEATPKELSDAPPAASGGKGKGKGSGRRSGARKRPVAAVDGFDVEVREVRETVAKEATEVGDNEATEVGEEEKLEIDGAVKETACAGASAVSSVGVRESSGGGGMEGGTKSKRAKRAGEERRRERGKVNEIQLRNSFMTCL